MALICCLADVSDSRDGDPVKVLPSPSSKIFLSLCTLMICLVLRRKNFVPFFKSSFKSKSLHYLFLLPVKVCVHHAGSASLGNLAKSTTRTYGEDVLFHGQCSIWMMRNTTQYLRAWLLKSDKPTSFSSPTVPG